MDRRLYPQGNDLVRAGDVVTTPTSTGYLEQIPASGNTPAFITLANLFNSPPEIGGTTAPKITAEGFFGNPSIYTAAGAINADDLHVEITSATPATAIALTIAAPAKGRLLIINQQDTGTAGNTVTLATGSWDGTNKRLTFDAQDETIVAYGISATRFVILENIGSVSLSTP